MSGEGSGVVGTSYTLTCRVSLPSGVEPDSLDIQWLGLPPTQPVMTTAGVYIRNLTLDPLLPNGPESYTCNASYTANGVSSRLVQATINIGELFIVDGTITYNEFMQMLMRCQWKWLVQDQVK